MSRRRGRWRARRLRIGWVEVLRGFLWIFRGAKRGRQRRPAMLGRIAVEGQSCNAVLCLSIFRFFFLVLSCVFFSSRQERIGWWRCWTTRYRLWCLEHTKVREKAKLVGGSGGDGVVLNGSSPEHRDRTQQGKKAIRQFLTLACGPPSRYLVSHSFAERECVCLSRSLSPGPKPPRP